MFTDTNQLNDTTQILAEEQVDETQEAMPKYTPPVFPPFAGTQQEYLDVCLEIRNLYREMMLVRKTRIRTINQGKAALRASMGITPFAKDDDGIESPEAKKASAEVSKRWKEIKDNPDAVLSGDGQAMLLMPFIQAEQLFADREQVIEKGRGRGKERIKGMADLVKDLPIAAFVDDAPGLSLHGLGAIIGACTVIDAETGDLASIGDFKSVSAVWKRLGLAVINGNRQGNPGQGASAEDWIEHGYNAQRRSLMFNIGGSLIGNSRKWRPMFEEDVDANNDYSYYQKVFVKRARHEAEKFPTKDGPVKCSDTGKESYSAHAINRAERYVDKRLIRELYKNWRRCM